MMAVNWSGSGFFGNVGVLNCFTSVQYLCSEVVSADELLPPLWQPVNPARAVSPAATDRAIPRMRTTCHGTASARRERTGGQVKPPRVRPPDPAGPGLAHRA